MNHPHDDDPPAGALTDVAELAAHLVERHGITEVMALGGQLGAILARTNDQGTRAWTLAQAAQHLQLELTEAMACYAAWQGAYTSWATHAADLRLAELRDVPQLFACVVDESAS